MIDIEVHVADAIVSRQLLAGKQAAQPCDQTWLRVNGGRDTFRAVGSIARINDRGPPRMRGQVNTATTLGMWISIFVWLTYNWIRTPSPYASEPLEQADLSRMPQMSS